MNTALAIRLSKILLLAAMALFFSIICFNNVVDYSANLTPLQHVLSMDTTFHNSLLMSRAIVNAASQNFFYKIIIVWEGLTALVCWLAVYQLCRHIKSTAAFRQVKWYAIIGLTMGVLLYLFGFIIIAGEWFSMWQSKVWNAQSTAGLFAGLILLILIYISVGADE